MSFVEGHKTRMIVDIPSEVQLAIKIGAVKTNSTTGEFVAKAVEGSFGRYVEEAKVTLAEMRQSEKVPSKSKK